MTIVAKIDPLADPRWSALVNKHPRASVFHTKGWLEALRRTYGYQPIAFTTSQATDEVHNGVVFCRVSSWLTGQRMVSLPFSDHCEPLFDTAEEFKFVMDYLRADLEHRKWKYLEVRPIRNRLDESGFRAAKTYCLHRLDLRPDLATIFSGLDKESVQRRIRRAERAGLVETCGRSEAFLKAFYPLLSLTRISDGLPPQPFAWYRNLLDCMGDALDIRMAYKDNTPVAAILTLRFRDSIVYKYGCSDRRFHYLDAMPMLLWRAIEQAKATGATEIDFGRSEQENRGLITFKPHWTRYTAGLVYWRFPTSRAVVRESWRLRMAQRLFYYMPSSLVQTAGNVLYRHIG